MKRFVNLFIGVTLIISSSTVISCSSNDEPNSNSENSQAEEISRSIDDILDNLNPFMMNDGTLSDPKHEEYWTGIPDGDLGGCVVSVKPNSEYSSRMFSYFNVFHFLRIPAAQMTYSFNFGVSEFKPVRVEILENVDYPDIIKDYSKDSQRYFNEYYQSRKSDVKVCVYDKIKDFDTFGNLKSINIENYSYIDYRDREIQANDVTWTHEFPENKTGKIRVFALIFDHTQFGGLSEMIDGKFSRDINDEVLYIMQMAE
ncbi:MAG: hypothetical protein NC201_03045 [Prevotella sp.]|nr:hypothetical protein [Bacteroides sp.]MCM1366203.1 hypothetical protein [Prevotella sp.]MCM1436955.1 hypothetical protein [Prevotella sp.]